MIKVEVKKVIKRDGRVVDFDASRIENAIRKAMLATNSYNKEMLEKIISYVLLIINEKYKEKYPHVEEIQDIVEFSLMKYGLFETAKAYVLYRKERERIREEKKKILQKNEIDEVDKNFSINALRILASRYLLRDEEGKIIETPKQLFQRVAALIVIPDILYDSRIFDKNGLQKIWEKEDFNPEDYEFKIGLKEIKWNRWHLERMKNLYDELNSQGKMKISWKKFLEMLSNGEFDNYYEKLIEYYRIMIEKKFMPNSPTLFNAGARLGQLSACFVLDIDDNIESIMETVKEASIIFKTGGGVGINYSKLRPEGDVVASTSGTASGPCSFMRIIDVTTDVIKQGGKRRGANMGILNVSHPEIEKFITLKTVEGVLENFNISVAIDKDFWNAYEKNETYYLINPRNGKNVKKIDPKHLLEIIALSAWKTADPGVLFLDNINKRNILKKVRGEITATNPCVVGDTLVFTEKGWIKAKLLKVGMKVWSGKGWTFIEDVIDNGVQDIAKVELENGMKILTTYDHKFLTPNGWKSVRELNDKDKIKIVLDFPEDYGISFDYRKAEWLGYWCGDGDVTSSNHVGLYVGNDELLANHFSPLTQKIAGSCTTLKANNQLRLDTHRKEFADWVRKLTGVKLASESSKKRVPEIILQAEPTAQRSFLRGLFSSDGSMYNSKGTPTISLSSSSKEFLEDVQILLLSQGIPSILTREKRIKGSAYKTLPTFRLIITGERAFRFYKKIGLVGEKGEKAREIFSSKKYYKTSQKYEYIKIKRIKYAGKERVFDIKAPPSFTWVTNGILSLDCGEQPLYPYESCNLGSINLYAFVKRDIEGNIEFDWKEFEKTIKIAIDFLDNVIDVNKYPLKKIEEKTKESRKIGLGIMGLADTLFALKIPYNSEEGFEFMRKIMEFIDYHAYSQSIERAKERGAFPLFEKSNYIDGEMPVEGFYHRDVWNFDWNKIIEDIKKYGVRNSNLTSIAPTGTISMIVDSSSGLEPQFALIFEKTVTLGKFYYVNQELEIQLRERGLYGEKIIEKIAENGGSIQEIDEIPEDLKRVFITAYDIPWWDHIRAQYEIGLWVDAGISKTINMANWVSVEDVKNAYLFAYKLGLKGITIYRDGSKTRQVLTTPTQRRGKYLKIIENKTIEMLNNHGIKVTMEEKEEKKINSLPYIKVEMPKFDLLPREKKRMIKKEVCPMCQSQSLVYHESCVTCMNCGWSECVEA